MFAFGYGLSYTKFKLSNLNLSSSKISKTGEVKISVDVENTGKRNGTEIVQLYVRDFVASMSRPMKELKGFERVTLRAGEKRRVEITVKAEDLGFYNAQNKYVVEEGEFGIAVGTSSDDEGLKDTFTVTK